MFPAIQVSPDDCKVRQLLPDTMEEGAQRAQQPSPSFDSEPSETPRLSFLFKSRLRQKYLHLLLKHVITTLLALTFVKVFICNQLWKS